MSPTTPQSLSYVPEPGEDVNSVRRNRHVWDTWDWRENGEEWTPNVLWKQATVKHLIAPYVAPGSAVVEIGPGGGRWSEELARIAGSLILVDLAPTCLDHCRRRFGHLSHVRYVLNDGRSLSAISDHSVDCIWSFDCFVHIQSTDICAYVAEFARVLKPGGVGVIHHSMQGRNVTGWRSDMTSEAFRLLLAQRNMECLEQFSVWSEEEKRLIPHDTVCTVFRLPAAHE